MLGYNFQCYYDFCGKEFNNKYNLKRHINSVHLQIKSWICEECGKGLLSKVAYKEHRYSHMKIKPIICPYPGCEMIFSRSSLLCTHKKTHKDGDEYIRTNKKYDKSKKNEDLPDINSERQASQSDTKVPLHHLLIR